MRPSKPVSNFKPAEFQHLRTGGRTAKPSPTTGDDADALFRSAVKLHLGEGVLPNFEEAAKLYERAAMAGHLGAMKNLAALYYDGKGVKLDHKRAFELYTLAAQSGDSGSVTSLAGMYLDGKGVTQDYDRAFRLYRQAADENYSYAQTSIGLMYRFGWGVPKDLVEATAWWLLASENGDRLAKENLERVRKELSSDAYAKAEFRMVEIRNGIRPKGTFVSK
jgi:TPR repeat protein